MARRRFKQTPVGLYSAIVIAAPGLFAQATSRLDSLFTAARHGDVDAQSVFMDALEEAGAEVHRFDSPWGRDDADRAALAAEPDHELYFISGGTIREHNGGRVFRGERRTIRSGDRTWRTIDWVESIESRRARRRRR